MHAYVFVAAAGLLAAASPAQTAIATVYGATVGGTTGELVAGAADMDGDLVPDMLVSSPGAGRIHFVSGATHVVRDAIGPAPTGIGNGILLSVGDMNLDGVPDVVANQGAGIVAFSGATAAVMWQATGFNVARAAPIGDIDSDGRDDLAIMVDNGSNQTLWRMSGANGALLPGSLLFSNGSRSMVSIGDITGDGIPELAIANANYLNIVRISPIQVLRTISVQGNHYLAASNLAGDSRNELLVGDGGRVFVYDTTNGALIRTFTGGDGAFAVVDDLDADGWPEVALRINQSHDAVDFLSGGRNQFLARWLGTPRIGCHSLAGVGDVDGDGYGDLLVGDPDGSIIGGTGPRTGGWKLISGKPLASIQSIPVQCTQGPWPPQLGMTRPILGQTLVIAGRDCPPNAGGILALSRQPALAFNLGVAGCDAYWDIGNWQILHQMTSSTWQLQLALPNVPQLAGLAIALQAFYLPTASPIGFDLSNAIWARIGH